MCRVKPHIKYAPPPFLTPARRSRPNFSPFERKSVLAVSLTALCLVLLAMRLITDMNFPSLLSCFGQPETKWIPLSYSSRQPLRTHYGYINVRTQEMQMRRSQQLVHSGFLCTGELEKTAEQKSAAILKRKCQVSIYSL